MQNRSGSSNAVTAAQPCTEEFSACIFFMIRGGNQPHSPRHKASHFSGRCFKCLKKTCDSRVHWCQHSPPLPVRNTCTKHHSKRTGSRNSSLAAVGRGRLTLLLHMLRMHTSTFIHLHTEYIIPLLTNATHATLCAQQ